MKNYYLRLDKWGIGPLMITTFIYTVICNISENPLANYAIMYALVVTILFAWLICEQKPAMQGNSVAMTLAYYTFTIVVTISGFIALGIAALTCNLWLQIFRAYFRQRGWFIFVFLICLLTVGLALYIDLR